MHRRICAVCMHFGAIIHTLLELLSYLYVLCTHTLIFVYVCVLDMQRQKVIIKRRLKVPPALHQFTRTLDKNQGTYTYTYTMHSTHTRSYTHTLILSSWIHALSHLYTLARSPHTHTHTHIQHTHTIVAQSSLSKKCEKFYNNLAYNFLPLRLTLRSLPSNHANDAQRWYYLSQWLTKVTLVLLWRIKVISDIPFLAVPHSYSD